MRIARGEFKSEEIKYIIRIIHDFELEARKRIDNFIEIRRLIKNGFDNLKDPIKDLKQNNRKILELTIENLQIWSENPKNYDFKEIRV